MRRRIRHSRRFDTVAEMLDHLGVPPERVRMRPLPGTATIEDAMRLDAKTDIWCELVHGTLIQRAVGFREAILSVQLLGAVENYLHQHGEPGFLLNGAGPFWIAPGEMRSADLAYFSWERFPGRRLPRTDVLDCTPEWTVDVVKPGNTTKEMARKRCEYFECGVKLVWQFYADEPRLEVFASPDDMKIIGPSEEITAAPVLPGFKWSIGRWMDRFRRVNQTVAPSPDVVIGPGAGYAP